VNRKENIPKENIPFFYPRKYTDRGLRGGEFAHPHYPYLSWLSAG